MTIGHSIDRLAFTVEPSFEQNLYRAADAMLGAMSGSLIVGIGESSIWSMLLSDLPSFVGSGDGRLTARLAITKWRLPMPKFSPVAARDTLSFPRFKKVLFLQELVQRNLPCG